MLIVGLALIGLGGSMFALGIFHGFDTAPAQPPDTTATTGRSITAQRGLAGGCWC